MAKTWTQRGGRASYGKTALSAKLSVSGMEQFFGKIERAGKNINEACKKAIDAALPIVEKPMREGAGKHRRTGDVANHLESVKATQQGNYIYGLVGIDFDKHPEAFEAVFQEYGDGHSPEFPDPFIRTAVDDNKKEIKAAIRKVLREEGVPIE